ncbi:unnamed protein product [Timema podura]|uniref:Uncharacterized protein n=1 Tax=Timema podura TaxID=61482 RepID=A0ABN7NKS4_TIMPD|nr:unnamed protein product [Timema podura]
MLHDLDPASSGMRIGRFNSPQPNHNLLQVKMEQVKMEPPDPKTQYTHQRQMYGGVLATTPSPNLSPSPQSHGRTPSPMDYTPAPAHAFYHPTSGMVMYRHTDFMGMGEVFQSPQVPAEGMGGAVNGKFFPSHLPTNPLVMFNPQRVLNPARRMPQTDMDMSGQGSTWGPVPPSSSPAISGLLDHSSMNIPPPAVSSVAGSVNPGEGSILDLDSHQYSLGQLDSAELANLSLFDGNLSENLSSNLTLSENPPPELKQEQPTQQQQQQQNDVQQENMTDSFTRLTTTTLEDICKLNRTDVLYRKSPVSDKQDEAIIEHCVHVLRYTIIRKVKSITIVAAFAWIENRNSCKKLDSLHPTDLPVISSLVYCETVALDHTAIEAFHPNSLKM